MKQRILGTATSNVSLLASATREEILVSQILLDLRNLIACLSESLSNFNWGHRRRRSSMDAHPPLPPAPSRLSPSVQKPDGKIQVRKPHIKVEAAEEKDEKRCGDAGADVRITASPDTPLSFSPCESDEKSNRLVTKTSRKRSREELIDAMEELTQRKDLLLREIQHVKKWYNGLKVYNCQLNSIKQEVLQACPTKGECQMEVPQPRHCRISAVPHQPPLIEDPTLQRLKSPFGPITARFNGIRPVTHIGPIGIDLNIPAEEAFEVDLSRPLDLNMNRRARFAEARRRRRGLIKIKAMRNACGIKLPA